MFRHEPARGMSLVARALAGALAGLLATAPMTVVMAGLHKRLPWYERKRLPPRGIVDRLVGALGLRRETRGEERHGLALGAHFAYGALAGALYGTAVGRLPGPPIATASLFGLALWGVSYMGWLPLMGLFPPATDEPARRNGLMVAAHLVWGVTLGALVKMLGAAGDSRGEVD